jgi:HEPN domain-containing protein
MNVTAEVLDWIRKAEGDLTAAYLLAESNEPLPDQLGFFCQQTAEKYLKAFLIAVGQMPPRIHDIEALLEICGDFDVAFNQLRLLVAGLTEFAVVFRYPDEWSDLPTANQALTQAEQVRILVRQRLGLDEENNTTSQG